MATRTKAPKVKPWRVVAASNANRTLLAEPSEAAARQYVELNFPRTHSEPFLDKPVYAVHLVGPDGALERYHVDGGWADYDPSKDEVDDDDADEDED